MKLPLKRVPCRGTADSEIVDADDKIIGRLTDKAVRSIVRAVNNQDKLAADLEAAQDEIAQLKGIKGLQNLEAIDLSNISRFSNALITRVTFDDYDLRRLWLTFGECDISSKHNGVYFLSSPMRDNITDFEHDTPVVVRIGLIGLEHEFTRSQSSCFSAFLTTDPEEIKVYRPDFDPDKVHGAYECEACEEKHLVLPDGNYVSPKYELAHAIAGKRVLITIGPRWDFIEGR